jgi:hypothetical protein
LWLVVETKPGLKKTEMHDPVERRVLKLASEQEVLWLEVPVHDPVVVVELHDLSDGAADLGGGLLGVVAAGEDAVEELAALAELHDQVTPFASSYASWSRTTGNALTSSADMRRKISTSHRTSSASAPWRSRFRWIILHASASPVAAFVDVSSVCTWNK